MDRPHGTNSGLGVGAYSLRDASFILHIPYKKLRRWAVGYWYAAKDEDRFSEAVVAGDDELEERILSFHELVELAVIAFFRSQGVPLGVVRAARARAGELFGTRLPFATKSLKTDGCGIFSDLARIDDVPPGRLHIELSKGQTAYSELVEPFFRKKLDFAPDGLASTYWPLGRRHPVLLDASRSFGRPIVQRTGTPTFVLYQMRQAGEEPARLARWYQITLAELNAALEYEESLRAAA